eukprot:IDg1430t1
MRCISSKYSEQTIHDKNHRDTPKMSYLNPVMKFKLQGWRSMDGKVTFCKIKHNVKLCIAFIVNAATPNSTVVLILIS